MAKKDQKSEGPLCACGKVDLYGESLKDNKNNKGEDTDLTSSNSVDNKVPLLMQKKITRALKP